MPVKKGQAPEKIPAVLNFTSPSEKFALALTFNNVSPRQFRQAMDNGESFAQTVFKLVAEWDTDYPLSVEGVEEFEDEHPGICEGIINGYWNARRVRLEKN